jgi:hypothetical protein
MDLLFTSSKITVEYFEVINKTHTQRGTLVFQANHASSLKHWQQLMSHWIWWIPKRCFVLPFYSINLYVLKGVFAFIWISMQWPKSSKINWHYKVCTSIWNAGSESHKWWKMGLSIRKTIELHAPPSWTQKFKLMRKGAQFTYTLTLPLTCRLSQAAYVDIVIILINAPVRIRTRDLWPWYHIELHAPTSSTQKFKLMRKGGQFTYTLTKMITDKYLILPQNFYHRQYSKQFNIINRL